MSDGSPNLKPALKLSPRPPRGLALPGTRTGGS